MTWMCYSISLNQKIGEGMHLKNIDCKIFLLQGIKYFENNHKRGIFCNKYIGPILFLKRGLICVKKGPVFCMYLGLKDPGLLSTLATLSNK